MEIQDHAGNLALFLLDKTGSIWGCWSGKLTAAEQRALFGRFLGKGKIVIDGLREQICNRVSVCFGNDWDDRNVTTWQQLNNSGGTSGVHHIPAA
ncbi:hypothetical protein ACYSUW_13525 [Pseudomonas frederiksbergensis]